MLPDNCSTHDDAIDLEGPKGGLEILQDKYLNDTHRENSVLGAVHMKIVLPLFSRLTGKKILFPRVHLRKIPLPGRDLFWQAVRWENFERSQYSKWVK